MRIIFFIRGQTEDWFKAPSNFQDTKKNYFSQIVGKKSRTGFQSR